MNFGIWQYFFDVACFYCIRRFRGPWVCSCCVCVWWGGWLYSFAQSPSSAPSNCFVSLLTKTSWVDPYDTPMISYYPEHSLIKKLWLCPQSIEQIANRADRMSIRSKDLYLYSSTDIEVILFVWHHLYTHFLRFIDLCFKETQTC